MRALVEGRCDECGERWENDGALTVEVCDATETPAMRAEHVFRQHLSIRGHTAVVEDVVVADD